MLIISDRDFQQHITCMSGNTCIGAGIFSNSVVIDANIGKSCSVRNSQHFIASVHSSIALAILSLIDGQCRCIRFRNRLTIFHTSTQNLCCNSSKRKVLSRRNCSSIGQFIRLFNGRAARDNFFTLRKCGEGHGGDHRRSHDTSKQFLEFHVDSS